MPHQVKIDSALKHIARQQAEHEASNLAQKIGLGYKVLDDFPFTLETLSIIPIKTCEEARVATYFRAGESIKIAVVHPEQESAQKLISAFAKQWVGKIDIDVVSEESFKHLLIAYAHALQEKREKEEEFNKLQVEKEKANYFLHIKSIDDLKKQIATISTTDLIDALMAAAYNQGASDIHLEPGQEGVVVRFRIDGVLEQAIVLPNNLLKPIVSRIKMMSAIHLDIHQASQDGRFSLMDRGINADVRVSIIPTGYGEGIVMRILRQDMQILTIEELGFSKYNQELINRAIHKPYGLILVAGPTGSGKSTTLYSILRDLNTPGKKIITLEDPIEYHIDGIQQSQVDPERGFSFAEGLKGALRQDPDVVMVGEIRDAETATVALNASLSGHLVLSTLHTNNAVAVHTRLLEMGIAPFLVSGSIQMIIAQRLVRKMVPGSDPAKPQFKGRIVIAEVLVPNQEFEQAVLQKHDPLTLQSMAEKAGMIPILKDGMEKVTNKITTKEEISRVTEV